MARIPPFQSHDDQDDTPLVYGKYCGETPLHILEIDPGYIVWTWEKTENVICSKGLYDEAVRKSKNKNFMQRPDFLKGI